MTITREYLCDHLHRFSQTHVVCQAGIEPEPFEIEQPGYAAPLIRPQRPLKAGRFLDRGEGTLLMKLSEHLAQSVVMIPLQIILCLERSTHQILQAEVFR